MNFDNPASNSKIVRQQRLESFLHIYFFILLRLNPFDLRFDRERWWFERSVSWFWVCLSVEGAKNVFWPWLSPLRRCGSLTMAFTGKFVYIYKNMFRKSPLFGKSVALMSSLTFGPLKVWLTIPSITMVKLKDCFLQFWRSHRKQAKHSGDVAIFSQ